MKTLYLARHAKSSWTYPELEDFERPLNKRGKKDAPLMGNILKEKNENPDLIISSPALRAIYTARIIAEKLDYPVEKISADESIYESSINNLFRVIKSLPDEYERIMIFGHNPAFTNLCNYISDKYFENIPTCGVVKIEFDISSWQEVDEQTGKVADFEYPKKHKNK